MQPENNLATNSAEQQVATQQNLFQIESEKRIAEMAKEAYLMRREMAIIAAVFFLILIGIVMFSIGSLTQIHLPV